MAQAITIIDLLGESRKLWVDDDGRLIVRSNIIDEDGDSLDINEDGSINTMDAKTNVYTFESISLLNNILKELKIMNLHMSLMTDNKIDKIEVE